MPRGTSRADEMRLQGRMDPDALLYIAKIERADNAALESGVKEAINNFVVACKDTKIWEKLGLVNIMAGARSFTGAITCLKGPINTLTNANFTLNDYSRKNGFTGDGVNKDFTTGTYWYNAEPLNDYHIAVNIVTLDTVNPHPVWGQGGTTYDQLTYNNIRSRSTTAFSTAISAGIAILYRDNSSTFDFRNNKTTTTRTSTSQVASGQTFRIFRSGGSFATHTMNFFSSGRAVPLVTYENLITTLLTDIGRAVN